jgi:hypothetical protein
MASPEGRHGEKEIRVFRTFATEANLGIIPASIEKRHPPEPDILCRLTDGSKLAFELVEIVDPKNAAFLGSAPRLAALIEKAYQDMPHNLRLRFDSKFVNSTLSFEFQMGASRNLIEARLPSIMAELANQPSGNDREWVFSSRVSKILVSVRRRGRVEVSGRPSFNLAGEFAHDDLVVERVLAKISKTFRTDYPVELLAYFDVLGWNKPIGWIEPLRAALVSVGLGPFRRVWIVEQSRIDFVFPQVASLH